MENYSDKDVERIIARAVRLQGQKQNTEADVLQIAQQMGIDEKAARKSLEVDREEQQKMERTRRKRRRMWIGFCIHFYTYLVINLFLVIVDFITGGPSWAYWPIMGWGIGLAFHALPILKIYLTDSHSESRI